MHIVGSDKYNERECPNCKKMGTSLFLKTVELRPSRRTPTTAGTQDICGSLSHSECVSEWLVKYNAFPLSFIFLFRTL